MSLDMITKPEIPRAIKWHGAKGYLSARIVALMPDHLHYVEPFFGAGAVLFEKKCEGISEVVCDTNGWLTNFWNVLRDPELFPQLQRFLEATPFSEALFLSSQQIIECSPKPDSLDPVTAAAWFFVCCRQSLAGRMDSFAPLSKNRVRRGMNEQASAWLTAIEGLPQVHSRLSRVVILCDSAFKVIPREDSFNTLFYLDPPYFPDSRTSPDAYGSHELTREQHIELLQLVRRMTGKVMISGYDCPLYADYLDDWRKEVFDLPNNAAGGKEKRRMQEVVWLNWGAQH